MPIYIVEYNDYDESDFEGYFTDLSAATACCEYLNSTRHSEYPECDWYIVQFNLNTTDYAELNQKLAEQEKLEADARMEQVKQEELAELARLRAKYGV